MLESERARELLKEKPETATDDVVQYILRTMETKDLAVMFEKHAVGLTYYFVSKKLVFENGKIDILGWQFPRFSYI